MKNDRKLPEMKLDTWIGKREDGSIYVNFCLRNMMEDLVANIENLDSGIVDSNNTQYSDNELITWANWFIECAIDQGWKGEFYG
jgi:hypothetical protein